jgi:hypothetical protein
MTAKEIYERIDLSQLPKEKADKLRELEVKTKGFSIQNDRVDESMRNLYAQLKEKKPSALKDLKVEIEKVETKKGEEVIVKETEKVVGKKEVTQKTPTPSSSKKETITEVAKKIRKEGEEWRQALKRAGEEMRKRDDEASKQVKTELQKLIDFVKNDPNFKDFPRTYGKGRKDIDILKDASEKALAPGRRVSKKGHMNQYGASKGGRKYTENRDNRSDREASKFSKNIFLAKGGRVHRAELMQEGGQVFVPDQILANNPNALVNTTTMNELFAKGGITSVSLFKLQDEVWDKFQFESGAEIKSTQQNRMKFSKAMDEALKARGVAKESLSKRIFEKLEDENAHTLNEFLILNDYYQPSVWPEGKKFYFDRFKENPRGGLGKDGVVDGTQKAVKTTSKGYRPHDTIKLIVIKNPNENGAKNYLTIDGGDVLNGVYDSSSFKAGGNLPSGYKYIRRGDVSQVVTKKNEIIFKPKNGFFVKKEALVKAGMNETKQVTKTGTYSFPEGQVVWDLANKSYGVVLNNFGDPKNGDRGEIRLDSDGMQSIYDYPDTSKYNLVPIGSPEDRGTGNLRELKSSAKRIIDLASSEERKKDYEKIYKDLLSGKFDKYQKMADGGEVFVPVQIDANNPDVLVQTTTMSELFKDGGLLKGRNNETGESFGVVIGSAKQSDEGLALVVRKSYGARISSFQFRFDENGNLKEILDYGYSLDGIAPDTKTDSGSGTSIFDLNKSTSIKEMAKLTSPAFAKKLYDFVQEQMFKSEMMANGGEMADDEGVDLFEDYEDQPEQVQAILAKYELEDNDYNTLNELKAELEEIGYTFEFGLDAEPYDLRKVGQKGKSEFYAKGGFVAMYGGKKINIEADSLYAAKLKAIEEFKVPKSKQGLLSVVSNKSMANQDFRFMADGGRLEAQSLEMAQNISVQIGHHAMELKEALEGKTYIEPWVTSMLQRAADNLSDATHYLEGKDEKMAKGGKIREFDDVLVISKNKLGMVEAIGDNIYYVTTPFGETIEATMDDLKKVASFKEGGDVKIGEIATLAKENNATGDQVVKKISAGADVEMEHTEDRKMAMRIAVDHLKEDFNYYEKLRKAGL